MLISLIPQTGKMHQQPSLSFRGRSPTWQSPGRMFDFVVPTRRLPRLRLAMTWFPVSSVSALAGQSSGLFGGDGAARPATINKSLRCYKLLRVLNRQTEAGPSVQLLSYALINRSSTMSEWVMTISMSFSSSLVKNRSSLDSLLTRIWGSSSKSSANTTMTIRQMLPSR